MKIKKGDNVKIITGKDKGKTGKVVKVLVAKNKVVVEGLNMTKKHQKARKAGDKSAVISMAMPIHASNVAKAE